MQGTCDHKEITTADGIGKGYDSNSEADTLKEAKRISREMLTEQWKRDWLAER